MEEKGLMKILKQERSKSQSKSKSKSKEKREKKAKSNGRRKNQRTSINNSIVSPLALLSIPEENTDQMLETTKRLKSIKENLDLETVQRIETCRSLKLPILKDLSEE